MRKQFARIVEAHFLRKYFRISSANILLVHANVTGLSSYINIGHSFMEIDHEIFSTVIHFLPLIQEEQLSVSGERMWEILVNHVEDHAYPIKVWLGKLTALDMTPLGWLGRKTSTQTDIDIGVVVTLWGRFSASYRLKSQYHCHLYWMFRSLQLKTTERRTPFEKSILEFYINYWQMIHRNIRQLRMKLIPCELIWKKKLSRHYVWASGWQKGPYGNGEAPAQFAQPRAGSRSSLFVQYLQQCPSIVKVNSEGPDQTARMRRLVWIFAVHICSKVAL